MSKATKRPAPRRPSGKSRGPVSRTSRSQLAFVIISSLVVCSMIGAAFVSLTFTDVFGDLFEDDGDQNVEDQNEDIVAAQQTVVASNPDNVEDLLFLANLLANTQRLGDAIPLYERALELAPDDVAARVEFARALAGGGLLPDAEFQFQRALELDPDNQVAHYYLATTYLELSPPRTDEAIHHLWRVVEIDPTTLIGEQAQVQLDTMGAGTPPVDIGEASPAATPAS
ncbi:MAG TPA: tetratricopeptide repeat protein [Thermomicrobiales bacterium]|nr:tetratricopeptide repeat protein [Thermomicrobiales bacterium]